MWLWGGLRFRLGLGLRPGPGIEVGVDKISIVCTAKFEAADQNAVNSGSAKGLTWHVLDTMKRYKALSARFHAGRAREGSRKA